MLLFYREQLLKKCTKIYNACTQLLFSSLNLGLVAFSFPSFLKTQSFLLPAKSVVKVVLRLGKNIIVHSHDSNQTGGCYGNLESNTSMGTEIANASVSLSLTLAQEVFL